MPALLECLQDERLLFCAHALQLADASVAGGALEILERADFEAAVEERDRLRTDPLQPQEVQYRWREFLEQVPVIPALTGVEQLSDLRGEVLADARNAQAIGWRQSGDRLADV